MAKLGGRALYDSRGGLFLGILFGGVVQDCVPYTVVYRTISRYPVEENGKLAVRRASFVAFSWRL